MHTYVDNNVFEYQAFRFDRLEMTLTARVLVIDDDVSFRELVKEELKDRRFSVCAVDGSIPVKNIFHSFTPDIVLLDLYMHGNRGWNILSVCKEMYSDLPVLIHTAFDSFSHDPRFCMADGLIVKSIRFENLIEAIVGALRGKQQKFQNSNNQFVASPDGAPHRTTA